MQDSIFCIQRFGFIDLRNFKFSIMKNITIILFFITFSLTANSQDFFLRAKFSSDHSIFPSQFHSPLASIVGSDRMNLEGQNFSQKVSKGTYAEGRSYSFGLGKEINNYVSIFFDICYQKGSGVEDVYTNIPQFNSSQFSKSETIRILPGLVLSTGSQNRMNAYLKTALVLPVWGRVNSKTMISDETGQIYFLLSQDFNPDITTEVDLETNTYGKLSFGIQSAVGMEYQLTERLSIFAEVDFTNLQIHLNRSEMINATGHISISGETEFPIDSDALPEFIKNINYHDELTVLSNSQNGITEFDPNKSLDALNYGSNFNSVGFGIGVKIKL